MTKKKPIETDFNTDELFATLSKGIGADILDDRDKSQWPFVDTGILGLNYCLSGKFVGGGAPGGVMLEAFGGSSSGKSLIGTNLLRGCQTANGIAVLLDAERTISKDFAVKASHVDPKRFLVAEADTLQTAFNKIHKTIRAVRAQVAIERPLVIVYDSIAASPSEREFAETELDMEEATQAQIKEAGAGADKPGERALICSKELRKLPPILAENNAMILFINQVRQKIGVLWGDPETTGGGGRSLEFYCSMRLKMSGSKQIKDKLGKVIGINVNIRNVKNKCFRPFTELKSLRLFFDKGIDPFGGLLELLIQAERIEPVKAGTYKVKEPYAGGQEITFRSNKERNDVPADVLLKCPALVDATEASQVQYYVDMFGSALSAVENDIGTEEDMNEE